MRLPVADPSTVRRHTGALILKHRRRLGAVVGLHGLAAAAGLLAPAFLGRLVDAVTRHTATTSLVDTLTTVLLLSVLVQSLVTLAAQRQAMVLGETVFADLREEFIETVTRLPLSVVERAGTGDLLARTSNDIDHLSFSVRFGVPRMLVAAVSIVLTAAAAVLTGPLVAAGLVCGVPILVLSTRWYLRRCGGGYQRTLAAYGTLNGSVSETVGASATVDALSLAQARARVLDADLRECFEAERYTLGLRTVWFPATEASFLLPVIAVVLWGGWLVWDHLATVGQVSTVALYAMQLIGPVDQLISWMDELQIGGTSLSRIIGVNQVPPDRRPTGGEPVDDRLVVRGARFAYREGHEVLHGVDLALEPGERLAVVGPSGAGKSTLGRLLAGVHGPASGTVTIGGVRLIDLAPDELRRQVALVTQEQHVFVGSLAENLQLGRQDATVRDMRNAMATVGALEWVLALPDGLDTVVGSGGWHLTPAQAQQLALGRLLLLDPKVLVLDEATSLLDPGAARGLERSLSAILEGRTVVAIAHRLHTAHDADRVAVLDGGRITEIGPHESLVAAGGRYAALWRSWHVSA